MFSSRSEEISFFWVFSFKQAGGNRPRVAYFLLSLADNFYLMNILFKKFDTARKKFTFGLLLLVTNAVLVAFSALVTTLKAKYFWKECASIRPHKGINTWSIIPRKHVFSY